MALTTINLEVFTDLKTDWFIETGTQYGGGVDYALELGFQNIISIDIEHNSNVHQRFANHKNVKLITGDSGTNLFNAIKDKNSRLTFWLDAHADLIPHENWKPICPIMEELAEIKKHNIRDHHIMIDDVTFIIKVPGITKAKIESAILQINSNYRISYADTGGTQALIASTNGKDYNLNTQAYR